MPTHEEEFLNRLLATFKIEAQEHVHAMAAGLLELEKTPNAESNAEQIEAIFRHAHSLKGAARAVNFAEVEAVCQSLEDVFAAWKRLEAQVSRVDFDTLHRAIDIVGKLIQTAGAESSTEHRAPISTIVQQLGQLAEFGHPEPAVSQAPVVSELGLSEAASTGARGDPGQLPLQREALPETIRVFTGKLDRLLLEAEELLMVKQTAAEHAAGLRKLEPMLDEWMRHWAKIQKHLRPLEREAGMQDTPLAGEAVSLPPGMTYSEVLGFLEWNFAYMKSLGRELRVLGRSAVQDQYSLGKLVDDLLADSKELLMLPFSTLSEIFPKLVRDLSRDQGKEVDLVLRGSDVEIDKRILEEMKDPLIHLVRNCIDHGIDTPEVRARQNRPPRATITIAVAHVNGNQAEITVSDDGTGIDLEAVKQSALKRGVVSDEIAHEMDGQKALELIFESEVSTSRNISEISGRGLGLAIVREKAEKLGGGVLVETSSHIGTIFRVILPLTLATLRGILVRVADQTFVIPTTQVERVARIEVADVKSVGEGETISILDRERPLVRLDEVLELTGSSGGDASDSIIVIVLGSGEEQIAYRVDEVLQDEEVLVKKFALPLSRMRNIAGATVLASGKVVPVLNVADLIQSARKFSVTTRPARGTMVVAKEERTKTRILLAEDSVTSRMLLKGILESAGHQVKTAVDGVEALAILRTEEFDVIVSDIEMPRMNGFDLTAQIRREKRLANKPVILVSALASKEHGEHGIEVGANAYIEKGNFDQSNLLDAIRRLA